MFEDFVPKKKIGVMTPLPVIENAAYEFYRLVPRDIMLVMVPLGVREFTAKDVERVFEPVDGILDMMMGRGIDIVTQTGVPLPLLIGIEAHDRLLAHMAAHTGLEACSQIQSVVTAGKHLDIKNILFSNKWSETMNATLSEFFARAGISTAGVAAQEIPPGEFQRFTSAHSMQLAYDLGKRALEDFPDSDGLYIGGGTWISQPVCQRLEEEFGKPVYCNQEAMIWDILHRLDIWKPIPKAGKLLGGD